MARRASTAEGDFEAFFREFVPVVRRQARLWVPASDVDDVVHATFVTAWQRFDTIPTTSRVAWLLGVARNHCRNSWRSRRRATNLVDAIEAARPKVDSALHDDNLDPATVETLLQVLRRLSDAEQELIVLSIWRELTPAEIGEVLGIPAGTVRVRLHRLRRRIEEEFMQANRDGGAA